MNLGEFKAMFEAQGNNVVNGSVSVTVLQSALKNANLAFFKKQVGIEDFTPNNGPYWQKCQQVTDSLIPFIKVAGEDGNSYLTVNALGYADVPTDYFMYSSMMFPVFTPNPDPSCSMIESEHEVIMVTDEEFNSRVASVRKKPTKKKAICTPRSGKLRFAPKDLTRVKMVYLREPKAPFFDYDLINGVVVYLPPGQVHTTGPNIGQPSLSVEFEWPNKYHIELYAIFASFLSDNLLQMETKQVSEQFKLRGI